MDFALFLAISIGINMVMFVPAFIYRTDKLTDISYALTFIVLAICGYYLSTKDLLHAVVSTSVTVWGIRLGGFLFIRITHMKKDKRFDGIREHFFLFLRFWLLQAVTVALVLLPAIILWSIVEVKFDLFSGLGLFIFTIGLLLEATADYQKFMFNKKPSNKHKWIDTGLWSVSRHPNYLGEILVWIGVYVAVVGQLQGWQIVIAAIGPLFISTMLLFVSGIPLLEKSADKRWGSLQRYKDYKRKTSTLIPFVW